MEQPGEKLAAEIDALNAELTSWPSASNASGARKDTLRAEITDLTAKRTEAQVAQAAAEAARGNGPSAPAGTGAGRAGRGPTSGRRPGRT